MLISIVLTFAIPKFKGVSSQANLSKLKSEYILIKKAISQKQTQNILLGINEEIKRLDNVKSDESGKLLFSDVIDFNIISTNHNIRKNGFWAKNSKNSYTFFIDEKQSVDFILEDGEFVCSSDISICKEFE